MRKNIRKSVAVLLASLAMTPVLTACDNSDITTSGGNSQTETKKTQVDNLGQERKNSEQNNSFAYYSMPSVLKVASLVNNKAFHGLPAAKKIQLLICSTWFRQIRCNYLQVRKAYCF